MAITVSELTTIEEPIGFDLVDIVSAGDLFRKRFRYEDDNDNTLADFTGFTPQFDIVNALGAVIITSATIVPDPGDATGEFLVELTAAQTTSLILAGTLERIVAYRLLINDGGGIIKTLFCGPFKVTVCAAAA